MSAHLKTIGTPSVRDRVSKEEWQMRVDLAAAYQLAAIFKWTDLIYTHFSARVPGTEDFLINPYGLMFDEITASSLVRIDAEGKIIDDPLAGGLHNVQIMSQDAADKSTAALQRPMRPAAHKDWPALLRMLERRGIKYAQ